MKKEAPCVFHLAPLYTSIIYAIITICVIPSAQSILNDSTNHPKIKFILLRNLENLKK